MTAAIFASPDSQVGHLATLQAIFGKTGEGTAAIIPADGPEVLNNVSYYQIDREKVKRYAAIGIGIGIVALLVLSVVLMAIFCPPVIAAAAAAVGVTAVNFSLPALTSAAVALGIVGAAALAFGARTANLFLRAKTNEYATIIYNRE